MRHSAPTSPLLWLLPSLAACGLETTWPKFHHDMLQTGRSQFATATNTGTLRWKFATGGKVRSSPAVGDDGTIYVGSLDGGLYAVKPDGIARWKITTGGAVYSSPAVASDGTIYVGSSDR